ncbi:hypothetical protein [Solwaraspora sp. WMMA2101]|uniref:hypothetical protein n=1 Tax=Solwaraspora sp. WMMA2101 TaxID=3404124 RepID=UPI003B95D376
MHPRATRLGVVLTTLALVVVTGGCERSDPTSQPVPGPQYKTSPEDICESLRLGIVLEQFDLSLPSDYQPDPGPRTERTHWRQLCTFAAYGVDERFATPVGGFRPTGSVQVRVYQNAADAAAAYDEDSYSYFDLREETVPGTTTANLTGWWGENGRSLQTAQIPNPDHLVSDAVVNEIHVIHLIRHDNLVLLADNEAIAPLPDSAEVTTLLHDLTRALIDETVTHLDRQ